MQNIIFFCRASGENAEEIRKFYWIFTHSIYLLSPSWQKRFLAYCSDWRRFRNFRKSQSYEEFTEKPDWLHGGGRLICEVCKSADTPADSYLDRWDETTLWKYYRHSTLKIRWSARYTGPALQMMLNARRERQSAKLAVVFEQDVSWAQTCIFTDSCLPPSPPTLLAGEGDR